MTTQDELAQQLTDLANQTEKGRQEVLAKIEALEAALVTAGEVTPAVQSAVDALKASVQAVDDIVPDAPVV